MSDQAERQRLRKRTAGSHFGALTLTHVHSKAAPNGFSVQTRCRSAYDVTVFTASSPSWMREFGLFDGAWTLWLKLPQRRPLLPQYLVQAQRDVMFESFRYLILVAKVARKAEWTERNFVDSGALELLELGLLGVRPFSARNFKGSEVQSSLKSGSGICFTCLCLVRPCTPSIQSFKFTKGIVLHSPPSYIGLSGAINYIWIHLNECSCLANWGPGCCLEVQGLEAEAPDTLIENPSVQHMCSW